MQDSLDFSALGPSVDPIHPSLITRLPGRAARAICVAAMLLSGCFTSGPSGNLGFRDIERLSDLDGVIQLSGRVITSPLEAEAVTHFLGIGYENVDLGLDEAGHGKYRSKGIMGGLLFIWFPIAAGGSDDVRFRRLTE